MSNESPKPISTPAPNSLAEAARVSPATMFSSPEDVVESDRLTKREKVQVLEQWEADAKALQTATDEGMSGGKPSCLDEVKGAQTNLQAKELFSVLGKRL